VKLKTAPGRAKPDTSRKLTVDPSGFVRNEWLETLSRVRADQPRRYAKEVSAGLQVTVSKYEQLKAEHGRQAPARAEERRGVSDGMREKGTPEPAAQPGTRMLVMPPAPADPIRLAEEQVESLKRGRTPRPVKTSRRKPERRGGIGAPRPSRPQGTS
jgi:hypothetical protein